MWQQVRIWVRWSARPQQPSTLHGECLIDVGWYLDVVPARQWKCRRGLPVNTTPQLLKRHTHTHAHTFNGPLSRTTRVMIRYQKGKTNLDFTEARDSEWQWHLLGHTQVCTSLQTDNHASTPPLSFYRPDVLPAAQPAASKHRRQGYWNDLETI